VWDWCRDVSGTDRYLVEAPIGTSMHWDDSTWFLQSSTQAHSPSRCPGISTGQASCHITSVCLASGQGGAQSSHVRSPTPRDILDSNRSPVSMTFKRHYL